MIRTVDHRTDEGPFRIVIEGSPPLPGQTVGAGQAAASGSETAPAARRLLGGESRGHADADGETGTVLDVPHDPRGTGFTLR